MEIFYSVNFWVKLFNKIHYIYVSFLLYCFIYIYISLTTKVIWAIPMCINY